MFFCLLLAVGALSGFIVPDKYYSESEKRTLTQRSDIRMADLPDGKTADEIERYLSDQFPLRDRWITLKTLAERLGGKTEISGVYFGRDGYLIDKVSGFDKKQLAKNAAAIAALSNKLRADGVPLRVMLAPTAAQILSYKLPPLAPNADQRAVYEYVKNLGVDTVDVFSSLTEHSDEYIYYRTDHHYTSLGAYYCYAEWMRSRGEVPESVSAWQSSELCSDFRGTVYSKINYPFAAYDTITAYYKTLTHSVSYNGGDYTTDSIYERKYLSGSDKYAVFLNSNQASTVIDGCGEGRLLIIKDSYANCFTQFVIDDFEQTHIIDPRFFTASVSDYINENGITEVLVLYDIPNFVSDTSAANIR